MLNSVDIKNHLARILCRSIDYKDKYRGGGRFRGKRRCTLSYCKPPSLSPTKNKFIGKKREYEVNDLRINKLFGISSSWLMISYVHRL
ncbi:hypothetical protein PP707_01705 [Acetobacter pasteurianus]|nr:hypothetical protein [Acetobacter pasteurianus]